MFVRMLNLCLAVSKLVISVIADVTENCTSVPCISLLIFLPPSARYMARLCSGLALPRSCFLKAVLHDQIIYTPVG